MFNTNYDTHTHYLKDLERQVDDARRTCFKIDHKGPVGWIAVIVALAIFFGTALSDGIIV